MIFVKGDNKNRFRPKDSVLSRKFLRYEIAHLTAMRRRSSLPSLRLRLWRFLARCLTAKRTISSIKN
jgi:hypothetical protein